MARNCPKDQVRALVEGTLDLLRDDSKDSLSADVTTHIEGCASCKKLKAKLEAKERSFRAALGSFGQEDSARCPSPAALASVAEKGLDAAEESILEHLTRCSLCRTAFTAARVTASVKTPDETIAAARRRVGMVRTSSDEQPIQKAPSGRRLRTARTPAISDARPNSGGLAIAIVAAGLAAVLFLVVASGGNNTSTPTPPAPESAQKPQPKPIDKPAAPVEKPASKPGPDEDVVAQLPPIEEEPREPELVPGPEVQKPDAPKPDAPKPDAPSTQPTKPTQPPTEQPKVEPAKPSTPAQPPEPTVLACKVDAVSGPVEIRKKAEKTWRRLTVAELVHDGDALRSKGEDGSITFSGRAKVGFASDAVGTVTIKPNTVGVALESGSLDGESLAYNGLEVTEANGFVTAWKGSKVHVDASEKGLHVWVEKGTANAGNDLGKVTVHSAHEVTLVKDRRPNRPTPRR